MSTHCAKWLEAVCASLIESAEAMTAPWMREQRRPPQRSVRTLPAAALLVLSGALALPATAQADVLVSNFGQPRATVGASISNGFLAAQSFSVASGGGNYSLSSIELRFNRRITSAKIGSLIVSVWSADSSGQPISSLHTLINPGNAGNSETGSTVFTAQAGTTLEAGNTYVVLARKWISV